MESMVLETSHIDESHIIQNLVTALKAVTDKWNITKKVNCTVTDAASNITGAVRSNQWNHLICFAHKLYSIVSSSIDEVEDVKEIMDAIKQIVSFFHKSSKASNKLRLLQARLNLPEHKLIQHVDTMWNSTFYMLERYLEQQEAVRTTLCLLDKNDLVLPEEKNPFIEEVIKILQQLRESQQKNVSASKILPLARGLQKLMTSYTDIGWMLAEKLIAQISTRFGSNMEEKSVLAVATLLDPRLKKIPFSNNGAVERMTRQIVNDATTLTTYNPQGQQTQTTSTSTSNDSITPNPVWEAFDIEAAESTSRQTPTISTTTEVEQYFKQPVINRKEDPLEWWRNNVHVLPSLQKLAKVYLSTVATSVPSERLFSKAGELILAKKQK